MTDSHEAVCRTTHRSYGEHYIISCTNPNCDYERETDGKLYRDRYIRLHREFN